MAYVISVFNEIGSPCYNQISLISNYPGNDGLLNILDRIFEEKTYMVILIILTVYLVCGSLLVALVDLTISKITNLLLIELL